MSLYACSDFINMFTRRAICFHRQAKLFEITFSLENLAAGWSNQTGKIIITDSGGSRPRAKGEGGSFDLLALLAFLSSVISSVFTQNKGDRVHWAPPPDPPLARKFAWYLAQDETPSL